MAKMRMLPFLSQFERKRFARKRVGDDQFFPPPGHCSLEWRRDENNGEGTVEYLFLGRFCHLNKKSILFGRTLFKLLFNLLDASFTNGELTW